MKIRLQEKDILQTLYYFDIFSYPPKTRELWTFSKIKTQFKDFKILLDTMQKQEKIFLIEDRVSLYKKNFIDYKSRHKKSLDYINSLNSNLKYFKSINSVVMIGISGSLSMKNVENNSDIDLFLVTKANSLWKTRFEILLKTRILSFLGNKTMKKLCWNIMMEESLMIIPKEKQNEYTAHEVLQMKPVYEKKGYIYPLFLKQNSWVFEHFPNAKSKFLDKKDYYKNIKSNNSPNIINRMLKRLQLFWLKFKEYKVEEYKSQAWFIQNDFEKKVLQKLKRRLS